MESKNIELKIYKRLAEIRGNFLHNILSKIYSIKNNKDPKKQEDLINLINNSNKWIENDLITAEEKAELELLKFLIEGEKDECKIKRYTNSFQHFIYESEEKNRV